MSTTRPLFIPATAWASGNPDAMEAPSTVQQERGWVFEEAPNHKVRNFIDHVATGWMKMYAENASTFASFDEPLNVPEGAPFEVGHTAFVDEESHGLPGTIELDVALGTEVNSAIAACPRGVVVGSHPVSASPGDPLTLTRIDRDGGGAILLPSEAKVGELAVQTDGEVIAVAGQDTLECFGWGTEIGSSLRWRVALSSSSSLHFRQVALSHALVFVTDGDTVRGYDRTTGAESFTWVSPNAGRLLDIVTDGESLFAVEDVNPSVVVHRVDVATATKVWMRIMFATHTTPRGRIALDPTRVYVAARDSAGDVQLEARSLAGGALIWSATPTYFDGTNDVELTSISRLAFDGRALWGCDAERFFRFEPTNGNVIAVHEHPDAAARDLAADGVSVWLALDDHAGVADVAKARTGHKIRLWRRVDVTARTYVPLHQELVPV